MFVEVGKNNARATRRDGIAFLMSLATVFSIFLLLFWLSAKKTEVLEYKEEIIEVPVSLVAPPPAALLGGAAQAKPQKKKVQPNKNVQSSRNVPIDIQEPPPLVSEASGQGPVEGNPKGVLDGDPKGLVDGKGKGPGQGPPQASSVKTVYFRDVVWKMRPPQPAYPEAARQMQLEGRCMVHLWIDETGKPFKHEVKNCPTVFEAVAVAAALEGRSYPYLVEGQAVPVQFDWIFNFKLQ